MTLSLVHTWMLFDNMLTSYFLENTQEQGPRIMNEQRIVHLGEKFNFSKRKQ